MEKETLTIGIIGAGYWGENLIRNFLNADGCRVKYICDLNPERLSQYKRRAQGTILTENANDIFGDQEIDVVVIATPVSSHFPLAKAALKSGKHVFVEKPLTQTAKQAEELIEIAKEAGLTLHVDHTFIYYGPIRKIKEVIDSGEIGDLHYFDSSRINLGLIQPDVNVFWDLAPHDISILHYLHPERAVRVSAVGTRHVAQGGVELAHITLQYESGFVAHIHTSWLSPVKMRQMTIGGSRKMVYFDDIHPFEKIKIYDKGVDFEGIEQSALQPIYRNGDVCMPAFESGEALARECAHFLGCVRDNEPTLTDGKAGLDVVRILEAAERSLQEDGAFIHL